MRVCDICNSPVSDKIEYDGINIPTGISGKKKEILLSVCGLLKRNSRERKVVCDAKHYGFHLCKVCIHALLIRATKNIKMTKEVKSRLDAFPASKVNS